MTFVIALVAIGAFVTVFTLGYLYYNWLFDESKIRTSS